MGRSYDVYLHHLIGYENQFPLLLFTKLGGKPSLLRLLAQ